MNQRRRIVLATLAALALLLAGAWEAYPLHFVCGTWVERPVEPSVTPITAGPDSNYSFDLTRLDLRCFADNRCRWPEGRVELLENGVRLRRAYTTGYVKPGRTFHEDDQLVFAPSHGGAPDASAYALRYLELTPAGMILHRLGRAHALSWLAVLVLVGCCVQSGLQRGKRCVRELALLFVGLFAFMAPRLVHDWDRVVLSYDTGSYIDNYLRPPFYPWFIASARGERTFQQQDFPECDVPLEQPSPALLRVTHAQKVVFYGTLLLMVGAFVVVFPHPAIVLFFLLLCQRRFLNESWCDQVLSEPVAQSLIHLMVSALLGLWWTRRCAFLPLMAVCFTAAVLTRSAFACYLVLLAGGTVLAVAWHWRQPRRWLGAVAAVGVIGTAGLACLLVNNYRQNRFVALSPLHSWERFAFALQCADASDVERMPSPLARRFLAEAMAQKRAKREAQGIDDDLLTFDLNLNCWHIGHNLANRLLLEEGLIRAAVPVVPRDGPVFAPGATVELSADGLTDCQQIDRLFRAVADPILATHRDRYWRLVGKNFADALAWSRIREGPVPSAAFLLGFLVCALYGRNRLALLGVVCIATHLFNLVVIATQEQPYDRYVWGSEWLCLVGFGLVVLALGQRRFGWFPDVEPPIIQVASLATLERSVSPGQERHRGSAGGPERA